MKTQNLDGLAVKYPPTARERESERERRKIQPHDLGERGSQRERARVRAMEIEVERERERIARGIGIEVERERGKIKSSHEQVLQPVTTRVKRESNNTKMIPLDKVGPTPAQQTARRAR